MIANELATTSAKWWKMVHVHAHEATPSYI